MLKNREQVSMAHIEIIEGYDKGKRYAIEGDTLMGRAPSNTICLADSRASRQHARLLPYGDTVSIEDMGSSNGTFVNGDRLPPSTPVPLNHADEIIICATKLRFVDDTKPKKVVDAKSLESLGMSLVVTDQTAASPAVNATIDASMSMVDFRQEDANSEKGLLEVIKRLQAMVKVSAALGTISRIEKLCNRIMDSIFDIFPNADRAFILLRNQKTGEMEPTVGRNRKAQPGEDSQFAVSKTIISTVIENRQSILSSDAQEDFGAQQSIVDLSIRSMMCVPFIHQEEILGVISVDCMSAMNSFVADDLAMLTGIASQAAISIKNTSLVNQIADETQTRAELSRYISPDIVEAFLDGTITIDLKPEKKRGTVFFCDIVGFTAMSEKMTATEVMDKLNRYFGLTTEIVTRNKGTLHKFGGDMIMAFWNVLLPDANAEHNAIRTSLEMQVTVWIFDLELIQQGQQPIYLGIGCNTGEFAGGNIGGDKIEYTIIGDNVNLGQRIESLAGRWQVFVSKDTYDPVKENCIAVALPPISVKGKSKPISIYSIRGIRTNSGALTLTIPVNILDGAAGETIGHGMMTGYKQETATVHLFTTLTYEPGDQVDLAFDLPEIDDDCRIKGVVESAEPHGDGEETVYSKTVLKDVNVSDEAASFLQTGSLVQSEKTWEQMKRK